MSQTQSPKKGQAIHEASSIIERFGGIRPMAKKMGVAVTTVQGWKKRDTIPAGRRKAVIESALNNDIDLSDILPDALNEAMPSFVTKPMEDDARDNVTQFESQRETEDTSTAYGIANENNVDNTPEEAAPLRATAEDRPYKPTPSEEIFTPKRDDLDAQLQTAKKKPNIMGWIFGTLSVAVLLGGAVFLFSAEDGERERFIETQGGEQTSFLNMLIPEDLDARIKTLQERTGISQEAIDNTLNAARAITSEMMGENGGTFQERAGRVNEQVRDLTGMDVASSFGLENFQNLIQNLEQTDLGQQQISSTLAELSAVLSDAQYNTIDFSIEEQLSLAQQQMPKINETLGQVPAQDLKAAAVLLAFSQFRQSLNRNGQAFNDDLQVLKVLVGNSDPELNAAIDRLAPYSAQGILTPNGLTNEFKTIAGEAVVASIKGEDVAFGERREFVFGVFEDQRVQMRRIDPARVRKICRGERR